MDDSQRVFATAEERDLADKIWLMTQELETVRRLLATLQDAGDTERYRLSRELETRNNELHSKILRLCVDIQEP